MGHCYSLDLRVRVADSVEAGHSCRAAAQNFDVSESFAIKLVRRTRDTGSPAPARQGRPAGGGKLVPYESFLIQTVEARPAITMPELAARLLEEHGVAAAPPALWGRWLSRTPLDRPTGSNEGGCAGVRAGPHNGHSVNLTRQTPLIVLIVLSGSGPSNVVTSNT